METFFGVLVAFLVIAVGAAVAPVLRRRRAARRHLTRETGAIVDVPARLRGTPPGYPGFWRPGRLELSTLLWRPRGSWGLVTRLHAAEVREIAPAGKQHKLPAFAASGIVLTCVDGAGLPFQILIHDESEAAAVSACLVSDSEPDRADPPQTEPPRARWARMAWLRNRAPLAVPILLAVAVLWLAYWLLPLLGAHEVDAVVTLNRGEGYLCAVRAGDATGDVDCGGRQAGEHLVVQEMGWPRTGTLDEAARVVGLALLSAAVPLLFVGMLTAVPAWQRRGLARYAATRGRPPALGADERMR